MSPCKQGLKAFPSNMPETVIFLVKLIKHATALLFLPRYFDGSLSCISLPNLRCEFAFFISLNFFALIPQWKREVSSSELRCILAYTLFIFSRPVLFTKIYRTIILPVVLYGCETWSLTLREEHRLRVF